MSACVLHFVIKISIVIFDDVLVLLVVSHSASFEVGDHKDLFLPKIGQRECVFSERVVVRVKFQVVMSFLAYRNSHRIGSPTDSYSLFQGGSEKRKLQLVLSYDS